MNLLNLQSIHWHLFDLVALVAQAQPTPSPSPTPTPIPTPSPSVDVDILLKQIEFLQDANEKIANNFDSLSNNFNYFLVFVGVLGAIAVFIYGKTLTEAEEKITESLKREIVSIVDREMNYIIKREVNNQISREIRQRLEFVERAVAKEVVIEELQIIYLLIGQSIADVKKLPEYRILSKRRFRITPEIAIRQDDRYENCAVLLDIVNAPQSEPELKQSLNQIANQLSKKAMIVVYIPSKSDVLTAFLHSKKVDYVHIANNKISLMVAMVDSAYVMSAID
ncbi:hypothetical protein Pse7367_0439 [Thalassoporum mexicanum PCC 7367]|uniref:hypothetical protein n=1 Tax=Thalassoporum mexicanum TaxID=3457544 RepID=UPI00029FCC25|nr:hypothetical protein [Pseudanabaena sp. PCC 7367]AFY68750.1 hypothetical protein Pse7367_0439 [Pseudanabaena sp. PCC 7367]